jgi:hypothetical protein
MRFKRAANAGFVERFYPKAKMIEISPFSARRSAAGTPQLAVDWHKVNQGSAGPQLDQTYRLLPALDRASQHITVKVKHWVQINHAQYQVINFPNPNHRSILIQHVAARTDSEIRVDRDHAIVELHRVLECYRALRLIDRNLTPSFIAFCATAPGVRRSFLAA